MQPPSGTQHLIAASGYRAVVTQAGATLRALSHDDRDLVDGFDEGELPTGARGQLLMPWPNRLRDGAYELDGAQHQLPLSEPGRRNAIHGLVRWSAWTVAEQRESTVTLGCRLMAQPGYPWTLDLEATYRLGPDGLTVTQAATNLANTPAPYAQGAHPYLTLGRRLDELELHLPAGSRLLVDDRKLPVGDEPLAGTERDFGRPRVVGSTVLDDAVSELGYADGRVTVRLRDPASGRSVELWADERHRWLQVYSGEETPETARRSLAVEPMTAPPDAFRTGRDLTLLAPGERYAAEWGIRAG